MSESTEQEFVELLGKLTDEQRDSVYQVIRAMPTNGAKRYMTESERLCNGSDLDADPGEAILGGQSANLTSRTGLTR